MSEMITPLERAVRSQETYRTSLNHVGTLLEPCWNHVGNMLNHVGVIMEPKGLHEFSEAFFSEPIDDLMGEALTCYATSHSLR